MNENIAIKVDDVSKTFKLPHEKLSSLKGLFINIFRGKRTFERQKVLKNVSFEVKKGEFFGIVGRNGSGKSTLLKLIAGIYSPNNGDIHITGKLTPFIELGVGFNPELTGRENVFLNGALLGFSRKEIQEMYEDIVEFAELSKFMDQKLKNYSSGMQVRLAFSIAIRSRSDILILDEVLAVGDEAFQRKCLDVFEKYKKDKQTIVLVTHDMGVVEKYCNRAILIHDGKIVDQGDPKKVARHYSSLNSEAINVSTGIQNKKNSISNNYNISIKNAEGTAVTAYKYGEWSSIILSWPENINVKNAGIAILKSTGEIIFANNTIGKKLSIKDNKLEYRVKLDLLPGRYVIMSRLFGETDKDVLASIDDGPVFSIKNNDQVWQGITVFENSWDN